MSSESCIIDDCARNISPSVDPFAVCLPIALLTDHLGCALECACVCVLSWLCVYDDDDDLLGAN